jgi:hypothetical protein
VCAHVDLVDQIVPNNDRKPLGHVENGEEKEDQAAAPVVNALNSCGATTLCLDLISVGIDSGLMIECIKLCVAMLFKEGGNLMVQQTMYDYLSSHSIIQMLCTTTALDEKMSRHQRERSAAHLPPARHRCQELDVLYSVINPRKQLAMTVLLGVFVISIFFFFIVSSLPSHPLPLHLTSLSAL